MLTWRSGFKLVLSICVCFIILGGSTIVAFGNDGFRPPAVPLMVHDPYFSVWSMNDCLTDDWTKHWTGQTQAMCGLVRIDDKPYRIIGPQPSEVPALKQLSVDVLPTRSVYLFQGGGIEIELTFISPLLVYDLEILSRPVSTINWRVKSINGKEHAVSVYLDVTGELVVDNSNQAINWTRLKINDMNVLRMGTVEQPVLEKTGDRRCIDWGYAYLIASEDTDMVIAEDKLTRNLFVDNGKLPDTDDFDMPRAVSDKWPVMAGLMDLGEIGEHAVDRQIHIAYDDLYSIEYLDRPLKPYWRKFHANVQEMISTAVGQFDDVLAKCIQFDEELMKDMERVGGAKFADIGALAYRQCLGAHKLAMDFDGTPLHFSKENFSNGCIATVDVTYPASPFFMLFNTELLKGQMIPILEYAESKRWPFPFAPHDLGQYPKANGQVYGGGEQSEENQMPVEESGNMLIMCAVIARIEGNADFVEEYWPLLSRWAKYLEEQGMDPENQLCTDDFAGHLAHNSNLSLKAIMALGGFSKLCAMVGDDEKAQYYLNLSKQMAQQWVKIADDGDHYRLAFDKSETWSQKYNLVWDELLDLHIFPKDVVKKEIAYYKTVMNSYGLPLDNRSKYTKADWLVWTASLTDNRDDFISFIDPLHRFLNETPDRNPFTDWYWTNEPEQRGFQARSVVGGVLIPMLYDDDMWAKWSRRSMGK